MGLFIICNFKFSSFDSCNPMLVLAVFRWPSRSMSEKLRPSMMWSSGSFTSQSARLRMRSPRSIPWDVESADSTAQSWQVCSKTGAFCLASMRNPPQGTHGTRTKACFVATAKKYKHKGPAINYWLQRELWRRLWIQLVHWPRFDTITWKLLQTLQRLLFQEPPQHPLANSLLRRNLCTASMRHGLQSSHAHSPCKGLRCSLAAFDLLHIGGDLVAT